MLPDKYFIKDLEKYILYKNELPKKHDTCIVILNYNNKDYILKLASLLTNIKADVLIVDNHSSDGSFKELMKKYQNRFNLIQTKENLGGAGGFGIGIQWVINKEYNYCFVSEDDALPIEGNEDIFVEMLKYKEKNKFIVAKYYELDRNSFTLHYTIYPTWILSKVGVPNINLFFRADDHEWSMRIGNYLKKNKININLKIVNRYYSHPLIKKGFSLFANYFSVRNAFLVYLKYPNKNFLTDYFINFVKYCSYSLFTYLNDDNKYPLIQFYYAFKDFLFNDLSKNKKRIKQFKSFCLKPKYFKMETLNFDEFFKEFQNYKPITSTFSTTHFQKYKFNFSNKQDVIASKYAGVARIKSFWYKNIVFVEEIDFLNKKISFFKCENKNLVKSRIYIGFSIFLSLIIAILFLPAIIYKKGFNL